MAEIALPVIVTAISNSEQESFVSGTLFTQGWSVIHRAVDFDSLRDFVTSKPDLASSAILVATIFPSCSQLTLFIFFTLSIFQYCITNTRII